MTDMHAEVAGPARRRRGKANLRASVAMLAPIVAFDVAGPITVQSVARQHGASVTVAVARGQRDRERRAAGHASQSAGE